MSCHEDVDLETYVEQDTQEFSCGTYDSDDSFIAPEDDTHGEESSSSHDGVAMADADTDSKSDGSGGSSADTGRLLYRWHLTKNGVDESTEGIEAFNALCKLYCKKYVWQIERAPTTDSLHYQARISLKIKARKGRVRRIFKGCHISPEMNSSSDGAGEFYATKDETRVQGPWTDKDIVHFRDQRYDIGDHYLPWQAECMRMLMRQDDRQILIVVDPTGHSGKTVLAHHIVLFHGGIFVPSFFQTGQEVLQFVHGFTREGGRYVIVVDVPRAALLPRIAPRLFAAFETIKAGVLYDGRYHGQMRYIRTPRIVCFCNDLPDPALLTGDRWDVLRLPWDGVISVQERTGSDGTEEAEVSSGFEAESVGAYLLDADEVGLSDVESVDSTLEYL